MDGGNSADMRMWEVSGALGISRKHLPSPDLPEHRQFKTWAGRSCSMTLARSCATASPPMSFETTSSENSCLKEYDCRSPDFKNLNWKLFLIGNYLYLSLAVMSVEKPKPE